jgi:hypothetical protein
MLGCSRPYGSSLTAHPCSDTIASSCADPDVLVRTRRVPIIQAQGRIPCVWEQKGEEGVNIYFRPARRDREMHESHCELFGGASGKLIVLLLTGGAFAFYVGSFAVKKRLLIDRRTWEVFWLDLLKMGLGQSFALAINVLNAHRNSSADFDPVSWYLPTFLNDEIIAVPLGVLIWHVLLLRVAAAVRRRWHPRSVFLQAL